MDAIFQRLLEDNFAELPGLRVEASIPLPERLLNEVIQILLAGNRGIHEIRAAIRDENRVVLTLKSPMWPLPVHFRLRLFGTVELSPSPKVRAFLENNVLLGRLGALLKALPEGIAIYKDQVSVDFDTYLTPEQRRLLTLVKSIEFKTENGKLILQVRIVK